jgi:ribonucleoside-diphosphate reductase alpha chain
MKITRRFTKAGQSVYDQFEYTYRSSVLRNTDGSTVFEMHDIEVPKGWSQVATDILTQKYFRKAGVPQVDSEGNPVLDENGQQVLGSERSIRQVAHRLAGCWTHWGKEHKYFDTDDDAQAFYDETAYMLMKQMVAPNSPQWFNTGLAWAYNITGPAQGHYYVDPTTLRLTQSSDAYTHPQPHACARGNTRLFTDSGILRIDEIVDGERTDLKVFDGERFVDILAVKNNGVRSVYRATLKNGNFIEFTDDHRIFASDRRLKDGGEYEWKELKTILGSKVQQVALHPVMKQATVPVMFDDVFDINEVAVPDRDHASTEAVDIAAETRAALAGWIVGDGYYGKYNANQKTTLFGAITVNDDEYAYVTDLFMKIFGDYKTAVNMKVGAHYRTVKLDSKRVDEFVADYELAATSYTVRVPERIFKGSDREKAAFLRSLFQADGCVRVRDDNGRNSGDVVLSTISEELAHGVQVLLLGLGIYSNISMEIDPRENRKPLYQVSISYASERQKFEQQINFVSGDKIAKLQKLNSIISGKVKRSLSEETVVGIEYIGDELVYDIQTESARFLANGVVVHNCFIQSVSDDLVNEGGIFDLITREARIFKYGSGTGSNFSAIRAENEALSGGGVSSGLMSFLKINDRAAGAVKSGGTTRRAAKMVILNADHPDIETFIDWKMVEEQKVAALVAGSKVCNLFLNEIMKVASKEGLDYKTPETPLYDLVQHALNRGVPMNYIVRVLELTKQGYTGIEFDEYDTHYEGEAYTTVSGQNSNNTVRITNEFMDAVDSDHDWHLTRRTDGSLFKTLKAETLWDKINFAAWSCADPGLQFDTTINEWHTCPKDGRINASNPCVTADTFVTTHQGLERIGNLVGEARGVKSLDSNLHWVEKIFPTGTKPVYELKTKSGYRLKLTGDHRVYTENRGDVQACELTKDDILRLIEGEFGTGTTGSEDMAQLIGMLIGDSGSASFLAMNTNEEAVNEWAGQIITSLRPNSGEGKGGATATTSRVQSAAPNMLQMVNAYVALDEEQQLNRLTDAVFTLNRDEQAAMLRGLFTAGGAVVDLSSKNHYIGLDSTSLELLCQVQLLLLNFGIKSKICEDRRAGTGTALLSDGNGGITEQKIQQMHSLRISRKSSVLFEEEIGFMPQSLKAEQLHQMNAYVSSYRDMLVDQVASLTYIGEQEVFDLTEPETHHFAANGVAVHNCSEYMFLDDTACNLASINLGHFYDHTTGTFDVEGYKHASRIWTVVLEVSVLMAQFPSKHIAQKSFDFRTLGLGYANLGTVLMTAGIPYDSDRGRAWAGALTAIMTGESYATSAELARDLGPFPRYKANAKNMLRVIRNHRRAAYNAPDSEYEKLTIKPVAIDHALCPDNLSAAAKECWDRALELGEQHGYRNAQVSVLAPTGTIGLVMDCDTTGIEPDFAIVKFKKLAGGGYFKIVNQSVPKALHTLGYTDAEMAEIERYIKGHGTLSGCPHINRASLKERGFTDEKIDVIERQLDTVFDIKFAFNKWALGEDFLQTLGFSTEQLDDPSFDLLTGLGFTSAQIEEVNIYVCGKMTIEGAPGLKPEHLPIFDCANKCGRYGQRYIDYMGHVKMMAAAQPFITGAISKTINMPNHATVDEVARVYRESWKLMLKAIALYRDGSKLSQPLNVTSDTQLVDEVTLSDAMGTEDNFNETIDAAEIHERIVEKVYHRAERRRLPKRRHGFVREATVGGHKVFLRTGEYEDGTLGEIFIDMYKEGASFKGLMNCFAVLASKALQYGMPLEKMVDTFTFTRFEPAGPVFGHEAIKSSTSIIDYVFRAIGYEYLGREDFVHVKAVDEATSEPAKSAEPNAGGKPNGNGKRKLSPGQELYAKQASSQITARAVDVGEAAPIRAIGENQKKVMTAKAQGYTGEQCGNCGSMRVKQNGACHVCEDCGTTSGCS